MTNLKNSRSLRPFPVQAEAPVRFASERRGNPVSIFVVVRRMTVEGGTILRVMIPHKLGNTDPLTRPAFRSHFDGSSSHKRYFPVHR